MIFDHKLKNVIDLLESQGLFANINRRRNRSKSRSKKKSTIDPQTYKDMQTWGDDINYINSIIQEALDQPVDIKWVSKSDDFWKGRFYIDNPELDKSYAYEIDIMMTDVDNPAWDISFYLTAGDEQLDSDYMTFGITGTGKSNTVFATVLSAIKQWIEAVDPVAFHLSALEDSRVKLYSALFKRFLPKGWRVAFVDDEFWAAKNADPTAIAREYSF